MRNGQRKTFWQYLPRTPTLPNSVSIPFPVEERKYPGRLFHLARFLASEYGNLRVDAKIVEIGDFMVTAQAVAFDLERNYAIRTEVKRRITDRKGQKV